MSSGAAVPNEGGANEMYDMMVRHIVVSIQKEHIAAT